jgi:predicted SAM-dependent methyltransferase
MSEGLAITHEEAAAVEIPPTADTTLAPPLQLHPSQQPVRLDLGGGQNPREGFACVDLNAPNPAHRVDLFQFPWPFADNSVDEIHCSHFIEHVPNRDIVQTDLAGLEHYAQFVGQDMLFAFFDECWRILKPGAWMTVVWPALQSVRAFQDPTHRRFIPLETMAYFTENFRKANALDHYRVKCNFAGETGFVCDRSLDLYHPDAQGRYIKNYWNVLVDHQAKMQALK